MKGTTRPTMRVPSTPPIRYFGGKWKIAPWVISHFPEHSCYVEPFGGGASVLFNKFPSTVEIYNDLYGEVWNFFNVLRSQTEDLVEALQFTPYSREEFERARCGDWSQLSPLERARRFWLVSWQGFGNGVGSKKNTGWGRSQVRGLGVGWKRPEDLHVAASRLRNVQLERRDAFDVIPSFDAADTLFYIDPPYLPSTYCSEAGYECDLVEADHVRLLDLLVELEGMVVLSGYASELYDEHLGGWIQTSRTVPKLNGIMGTEVLYLNPAAARQTRLF